MSINIPEGNYQGQAVGYEFGNEPGKGPTVKITMKVTEGPYAGQTAQFKNGFGAKAVRYTKRALLALGWSGKDIATAKDEIIAAKRIVPMQINIAEFDGRQWSSVRSIGAFGKPLEPVDNSTMKDVNQWLAEAPGEAEDGLPF